MSDSKERIVLNNGIGFGGILAIVFIVLKLTDYIGWSWVWVLSPLWLPFMLVFVMVATVAIFDRPKEKRRVNRGKER